MTECIVNLIRERGLNVTAGQLPAKVLFSFRFYDDN